jgi:hypothetical protein
VPVLPPGPAEPGADPVERLVEVVTGLLELLQGSRRELLPTVIGQVARNPALAEALRAQIVQPRLRVVTELLGAVPGVDPDRVPGAAELIPASLMFQVIVLGRHVTDRDLRRVIESAIATAR